MFRTCSDRPANYPDSQPINFVRSDAPPMLLLHGLKDDTVWPKNSRNLATALDARGAQATLKLYPKLVACRHRGRVEPAGARPGADARRHRGIRQPQKLGSVRRPGVKRRWRPPGRRSA